MPTYTIVKARKARNESSHNIIEIIQLLLCIGVGGTEGVVNDNNPFSNFSLSISDFFASFFL